MVPQKRKFQTRLYRPQNTKETSEVRMADLPDLPDSELLRDDGWELRNVRVQGLGSLGLWVLRDLVSTDLWEISFSEAGERGLDVPWG